jgi:hypothetical protein
MYIRTKTGPRSGGRRQPPHVGYGSIEVGKQFEQLLRRGGRRNFEGGRLHSTQAENHLAQAGHKADRLTTSVSVGFQPGEGITGIQIRVRGKVPGLDDAGFKTAAQDAGQNCPVSKALAGTTITVEAALE